MIDTSVVGTDTPIDDNDGTRCIGASNATDNSFASEPVSVTAFGVAEISASITLSVSDIVIPTELTEVDKLAVSPTDVISSDGINDANTVLTLDISVVRVTTDGVADIASAITMSTSLVLRVSSSDIAEITGMLVRIASSIDVVVSTASVTAIDDALINGVSIVSVASIESIVIAITELSNATSDETEDSNAAIESVNAVARSAARVVIESSSIPSGCDTNADDCARIDTSVVAAFTEIGIGAADTVSDTIA
jgi:hypothetical protein